MWKQEWQNKDAEANTQNINIWFKTNKLHSKNKSLFFFCLVQTAAEYYSMTWT